MIQNYDDALAFIHGRTKFKKAPTLKRMRRFLAELGNPQNGLHYIHVTGTNGKGSTVAMLRAMLLESGLTVGSFTSPFITRFNERIAYNAEQISDDDLVRLTQRLEPVVAKLDRELSSGGPTEFEIDTALMFCYMAEKNPDVVLLEVGIGGLYDSTNVITPDVSVITTVGWDHMKYLGDTLAAIATQKAGIIKSATPVVIGQLPESARKVIVQTADKLVAPRYELGRDFTAHKLNSHALRAQLQYDGLAIHRGHFRLGLAGDYQVENAAIALTAAQLFLQRRGLPLDQAALRKGLASSQWPGRMEVVNDAPLVLLDGAHNLPGIQALVKSIQDDFADRDVYVLVAILADKQYDLMLGELASLGNVHLTVTSFAGPGPKRPSADLATVVDQFTSRYPIQVADNWQVGFSQVAGQLSEEDVMIVTGSLYFIADVRHLFDD
ncbi:bifunctional folylpolyglutamate synthase/dihydrofolate synthase [Limosilactobacillus pontis]|uniref:bifunctional folylpolyglutamate synthase/dihydrofolate synthase n=1 Tax=Limosilactobacillus pontis TaxID=35787 RepID=UPI001D8AAFEC|nr:folylpolyglutamate synthase/dihydrofolate synthase family protein [Limosilactobacillus pontis]HJE26670.1 bifunctional folylpolyglutamate synthase/dihydrofolate synthase [Limosilactobacillus pontis]